MIASLQRQIESLEEVINELRRDVRDSRGELALPRLMAGVPAPAASTTAAAKAKSATTTKTAPASKAAASTSTASTT